MNTQGTAVHVRLWQMPFWHLALANLLLSISVTILIPTLPQWLRSEYGFSNFAIGLAMGAFAVGLFLPGAFCSWLVQRFRRNLVFVAGVLLLASTMAVPLLQGALFHSLSVVVGWRIVQGMTFGLSQMVLVSTLVIDTSKSAMRTEANHSATWFGRFALSLGPVLGLLLFRPLADGDICGMANVFMGAFVCCMVATMLVLRVHFPFRVPDDHLHVLSLDRFLLPSGWALYCNLLLVTVATGLLLSLPVDISSYAMVMVGFLLALLSQRFVFRNAELKSEIVTGLLLMAAAQAIMLSSLLSPLTAPLLGLGLGLVGTRFLLFFVKLSRHCQRGTSQSTFMLGWESGLAIGLGLGYALYSGSRSSLLWAALVLTVAALLFYVMFVHRWFLKHKNR